MSYAEAFEDDFGPVREASAEEIREEQLQRQARRGIRKVSDSVLDTEGQIEKTINIEKDGESSHETSNPTSSVTSHKRQLFLTGHDELVQYLEEKKLKKLRKQQQNPEATSSKRSRVTLVPMEESMRQKIVAELEIKKQKLAKNGDKPEKSEKAENTSTKRRHMMLVPMEDSYKQKLIAELETKKGRKNASKETSQTIASKRPRMTLLPMDESYRQEILAELEMKKQKIELTSHDINNDDGDEITETGLDQLGEISVDELSASSDSEFEDASQNFHDHSASLVGVEKSSLESTKNNEKEEKLENQVSIETEQEKVEAYQEEQEKSKTTDPKVTAEVSTAKSQWNEEDVKKMRKLILSQVNGNTPLRIKDSSLSAPYKEIYSILDQTIHNSESHTVLLTGPPGSGKTTIVEQALSHFQKSSGDKFIAIRLSGSLHHTDQHAIREIARQLDIKLKDFTEDMGGDTYEQRAISDTFQNILSTLFKLDDPSETGSKEESSIRVIFIIDELEKFTGNPKQTLLYNLFELAQGSKVPICIVGVTPKVTIREFFEKRVRSRFSQRMVQAKKADSMELFWQDAKLALTVPDDKFGDFSDANYPQKWNEKIEELFRTRSGLTKLIFTIYYTTKNLRQVNNECALPIHKISQTHPFPQSEDFEAYSKNATRGMEAVIASLSPAELIMVVAAARWIAKSDPPQVNFKLAYNEYTAMMKTNNAEATTLSSKTSYIDNMSLSGIKVYRNLQAAKVLQGCWRVIYRTGLLFDVISSNNEVNATNNLNMYRETMLDDSKMLQLDISLEELAKLIPEDNFVRRFTRL